MQSYSICLLCDWLISLSRMSSKFIHVSGFPSFLRLINIPLYGSTIYCLSIHPSMDTGTPLAMINLPISLNSFPLAPCLQSINVPTVLSNQAQLSLPWSSHPFPFLTLPSRAPPPLSLPPTTDFPLNWIRHSPLQLYGSCSPKSHQLSSPGSLGLPWRSSG